MVWTDFLRVRQICAGRGWGVFTLRSLPSSPRFANVSAIHYYYIKIVPTAYAFVVGAGNSRMEDWANDLAKLAQEAIARLRVPPASVRELPDSPLPLFKALTRFILLTGPSSGPRPWLLAGQLPLPAAPPKRTSERCKAPAGGLSEAVVLEVTTAVMTAQPSRVGLAGGVMEALPASAPEVAAVVAGTAGIGVIAAATAKE